MKTASERNVDRANALIALLRELCRAEAQVAKTSAARRDLPAGSSRPRVTTANARWMTACEHRDRILRMLSEQGVVL
jgi:hypothetical protein